MSDKTSSSSSGGIGFVGLLTIVFITLKLLGKITWPWIWVLSPLWIAPLAFIAIALLVLGGAGVVMLGLVALEKHDDRKRLRRSIERREKLAAERAKTINAAQQTKSGGA